MVHQKRERLTGIVDVDETSIGGKKPGKWGRGAGDKNLVVVAVEDKGKHIGRIRLHRVKDASADSFQLSIKVWNLAG